jgi:glyoxylase-like metal-dependent hydrolase (beta-lactamase superfamily II)
MIFQQISVGGRKNFGYYICDEQKKEAAFIDPSFSPEKLLGIAEEMGAAVKYVINTHSHEDHTNGNKKVVKETGAVVAGYGLKGKKTLRLKNGSKIELGGSILDIIHTPGHTNDSICIKAEHNLITGDTLFVGRVGSTKTIKDARKQYESLQKLMETIPNDTDVFPGHDFGVRPLSTIRYEKDNNPFLNTKNFEEFVFLKRYWAKKKKVQRDNGKQE